MELLRKAKKLLRQAFPPPAKVSVKDEDGIIGLVTSSAFRGLDTIDRQDMIWEALDEKLSTEERRRIVIIIAVTPEEEIAHLSK